MPTLLGYLSQFGSFLRQGEVLCTQGLCYLLREHKEARGAIGRWIEGSAHVAIGSDLVWHAEVVQPDGGRVDLQGIHDGKPAVKVEAKLSAPFGVGQLRSYAQHLVQVSGGGVLLVLVPRRREREAERVLEEEIRSLGPVPVTTEVVSWEDLLREMGRCEGERVRAEVEQFSDMYRVLNGDDIQPLASPEDLVAWHNQESTFIRVADRVSRLLNGERSLLPMGVESPEQEPPGGLGRGYRRRYVYGPLPGTESLLQHRSA